MARRWSCGYKRSAAPAENGKPRAKSSCKGPAPARRRSGSHPAGRAAAGGVPMSPKDSKPAEGVRPGRASVVARKTKETEIRVRLDLDGSGQYRVSTGIAFFDHMRESFARHGLFDLELEAKGDLAVDLHHTVEDVGIALGQAFREALGSAVGIKRFGSCLLPMAEAKVEVAVDVSNRPYLVYQLPL